ncbi:hypothetical protein BC830DRAFT_1165209 [Chytriomyces sp. MP71]|nr:hypothetical protein BC830DRAFT_1165209 [Chytriomyces sp. MP71]
MSQQHRLPPMRLPSIHEMMLLYEQEESPSVAPNRPIPAPDSEQRSPNSRANLGSPLLPALDSTAGPLMAEIHVDRVSLAATNPANPSVLGFCETDLNPMAQLQAAVAAAAAAEEEERPQSGFGHSLHGDGAPGASPAQIQIQLTLDTGLMHVDQRALSPPRILAREQRRRRYRQSPAEEEHVDDDELEHLEELAKRRHEENKERYRSQYDDAIQRWREEEHQRAEINHGR